MHLELTEIEPGVLYQGHTLALSKSIGLLDSVLESHNSICSPSDFDFSVAASSSRLVLAAYYTRILQRRDFA